MKKKVLLILPTMVAVVSFVRFGNDAKTSNLMTRNIEALTDGETTDTNTELRRQKCFEKDGVWGYHTMYQGVKEVEAGGTGGFKVIWNGKEYSVSYSTKKDKTYKFPLTEYKCEPDAPDTSDQNKNCCTKQGLFYGTEQVG
ncbi:MAG: hypothetical protein NC080_11430 [Paraprevotella sp.]|nr:hypothetical protein [Paraprevotella sp.]